MVLAENDVKKRWRWFEDAAKEWDATTPAGTH